MANGAAVALRFEPAPEPPSASSYDRSTPAPSAANGLELELAVATVACAQAMLDYEANGQLAPATRELSGEVLAKVCRIRLEHFDEIDLTTAVAEAKRLLRQRHGAAWQTLHGTGFPEAALDTLIGLVVAVTDKVVADEQALARAQTH